MIKYAYNSVLNNHEFIIHEEINGYYISFMYQENIDEGIDWLLMSNANEYTNEKICEEIVKVLKNKLIQFNEENINMPTKIIDFVWEELIYKLNINIKF
jgi:hypothetical protein